MVDGMLFWDASYLDVISKIWIQRSGKGDRGCLVLGATSMGYGHQRKQKIILFVRLIFIPACYPYGSFDWAKL